MTDQKGLCPQEGRVSEPHLLPGRRGCSVTSPAGAVGSLRDNGRKELRGDKARAGVCAWEQRPLPTPQGEELRSQGRASCRPAVTAAAAVQIMTGLGGPEPDSAAPACGPRASPCSLLARLLGRFLAAPGCLLGWEPAGPRGLRSLVLGRHQGGPPAQRAGRTRGASRLCRGWTLTAFPGKDTGWCPALGGRL